MRMLDHEQGSPEWFAARIGVPTASRFKDIITSQGKKATAFNRYADELVAERIRQQPTETFQSDAMRRGNELEPEARSFYSFVTGREVQQCGLCLLDDHDIGASPDGLMPDRGLEIKCPKPNTQVAYLSAGKLPAEYVPQVQGQLWICERDQWDFLSYHPEMPPLLITVKRDDQFIDLLASLTLSLLERVENTYSKIMENAA